MTRKEIEENYNVDSNTGIITSPGKFEGEMYYVVNYWGITLDGFCHRDEMLDDGTLIAIYDLSQIDYDAYPELEGNTELKIWENEQGFIYCVVK